MNKNQILDYLEKLDCVDGIVYAPEKYQENEAHDSFYKVHTRLIKDNVIFYRDINIAVVDEGKKEERAYFIDESPQDKLIAKADIK
jgi:hypothetical protein